MPSAPQLPSTRTLAKLRQKARLEATIEVWRPRPGDVLEGVIVGSRMADGPFGEQRQALVQTPVGTVVAFWLSPWLLGQLQAQAAEKGDLLSITFFGKETGGRGQSFNRMRVSVLKS